MKTPSFPGSFSQIAVVLLSLMFACQVPEQSAKVVPPTTLHPPDWIQGIWETPTPTEDWQFTEDDAIHGHGYAGYGYADDYKSDTLGWTDSSDSATYLLIPPDGSQYGFAFQLRGYYLFYSLCDPFNPPSNQAYWSELVFVGGSKPVNGSISQ